MRKGQDMITNVHDWLIFLRHSDALISFPLVIGGAALMMFGWRMWRMCVALSFGLIGFFGGAALVGAGERQLLVAVLCAATLGLVSYWAAKRSVAVLGGLIGAGVALYILTNMHIKGPSLLLVSAAVFIVSTALGFSNKRLVVIGVTSVLGAVLCISGVTALLMASPRLYGTFSGLASGNVLLVGFILLVPAVIGWFYQVSEVRRVGAEL